MKFKTAYSPSADDPGVETGPGITEQHHQESCDINYILDRYTQTGYLPPSKVEPMFADTAELGDFLETQLKVKEAEAAFNSMDARVRQRFNNSPEQFMEFIHDPKNIPEAIKLGLVNSKPNTPVNSPAANEPSKPNNPV